MKAIYKVIRESVLQLRWVKGPSLQERFRKLAQQRLNEIIRIAYGIEAP